MLEASFNVGMMTETGALATLGAGFGACDDFTAQSPRGAAHLRATSGQSAGARAPGPV